MNLHVCICIRGLLGYPKRKLEREWGGVFLVDGRKLTSADEIRDLLMDELAAGHEVLPFGEPCEGFDYKKGCPGHEEKED